MVNYREIIFRFYPAETPLRQLLLLHSGQVRDKALQILREAGRTDIPEEEVIAGAMLHDIGILQCNAPSIYCNGPMNYIAHGILGAAMLRELSPDLEPYARICERHTGTGITRREIEEQHLPLPLKDYLPETPLEKLICLADKFYSKSSPDKEKKLPSIRHSIAKFGQDSLERFQQMCRDFLIEKQ